MDQDRSKHEQSCQNRPGPHPWWPLIESGSRLLRHRRRIVQDFIKIAHGVEAALRFGFDDGVHLDPLALCQTRRLLRHNFSSQTTTQHLQHPG